MPLGIHTLDVCAIIALLLFITRIQTGIQTCQTAKDQARGRTHTRAMFTTNGSACSCAEYRAYYRTLLRAFRGNQLGAFSANAATRVVTANGVILPEVVKGFSASRQHGNVGSFG